MGFCYPMSPDYEPDYRAPEGVEVGAADTLWTPTNVKYLQSWMVAIAPESQQAVWKIEFELNFQGEKRNFSILWEEGDSEDQIEDLIGWTAERTALVIAERQQQRGNKLRAEDLALRQNWDVRRQLAGAWRDYRAWRKKQKESSTGKTQFKGTS